MLAKGAMWPSTFTGQQIIGIESARACWRYHAAAWALSKGCSWGVWRCQDLAPDLYTVEDDNREDAVELFEWAHENGSPCTCEAATAAS
jgi:hypothetical protein